MTNNIVTLDQQRCLLALCLQGLCYFNGFRFRVGGRIAENKYKLQFIIFYTIIKISNLYLVQQSTIHSLFAHVSKKLDRYKNCTKLFYDLSKKSMKKLEVFNPSIGRSPYEAMFGCPVRVGLASIGIPLNEIENLKVCALSRILNQLELLDIHKSIKEKELTLREAAGLSSISGTQGYQQYHCKTKCKNNKCACRSSGKLCNSKCHGSLICENKALRYKFDMIHFLKSV
ncbi:hypothetical protein AGLY_009121 [Aphis glycines]|uniref:Uncharacterized protein n=1 Tax=Aphis glycines TaxID=307491 RepID=A0A6G0TIH1_APHGL|nr:hypothetical protein AGLY_009121 [Aphis glycines]